jgi:hypothetical protein
MHAAPGALCLRTRLLTRRSRARARGAELDKLSASTPEGTAAAHAAKLAALRKRVGALSSALHAIQERLNRLHAALGRLPAVTLAELSRQELHAPPPPSPDALAARAGPLAAGAAQLLAATAAVAPGAGAATPPPPAQQAPPQHSAGRATGVTPQLWAAQRAQPVCDNAHALRCAARAQRALRRLCPPARFARQLRSHARGVQPRALIAVQRFRS